MKESLENRRRIQWIDVAKGICMLCVIAGHMGLPAMMKKAVFSFHLTVFFILSGYTLKNDLSVESLAKRFKGLMVPYFATCIAVAAMDVANQIILNKETAVKALTEVVGTDFVRSYMASGSVVSFAAENIGTRIGAIWFFPALFFAVLIAQLLLRFVDHAGKRYVLIALPVVLSCYLAKFVWLPFSIQSAVLAAPFILLGYDMRQSGAIERISLKNAVICAAIFAFGIVTGNAPVYYVKASMPDFAQSMFCATASSLLIIYIAQKLEKCRPLAWIGKNSLYFLCLHLFEMETMGAWFQRAASALNLPWRFMTDFAIRLVFISVMTVLILLCKRRKNIRCIDKPAVPARRDAALDLAKAILIILMIIGHFDIGEGLRNIIFSFHMAAFVFYSGYCFREEKNRNVCAAIGRQAKSFLVPYALFGILYVLLTDAGLAIELKRVVFGISYTKKLFTDVASIGPVYFILLLFAAKVAYILIARFVPKERNRAVAVFALSLLGQYLGKNGYWLPWSIDCALYCLSFYYAGHCFNKYGVMEYFCKRNYSYFLLSTVWAYMIYKGGMEIALRKYGVYSVTLLGAVSASVLLYMACRYLYEICCPWLTRCLTLIGENTLFILIVHKQFGGMIKRFAAVYFAKGHIYHTVTALVLQLTAGIVLGVVYTQIRKAAEKALKGRNARG